jgi:hypothetical protein
MLGSPPVNNIVIDADRHWLHGDFSGFHQRWGHDGHLSKKKQLGSNKHVYNIIQHKKGCYEYSYKVGFNVSLKKHLTAENCVFQHIRQGGLLSSVCWFVNPMNTSSIYHVMYLSTTNHRIHLVHQLSYRKSHMNIFLMVKSSFSSFVHR